MAELFVEILWTSDTSVNFGQFLVCVSGSLCGQASHFSL